MSRPDNTIISYCQSYPADLSIEFVIQDAVEKFVEYCVSREWVVDGDPRVDMQLILYTNEVLVTVKAWKKANV